MDDIDRALGDLRERGLYRELRTVSGRQGTHIVCDGRSVLLLCSNNYLGLAQHPRVREQAADAALRFGAGAGASRLVSGNMTVHIELERLLAEFKQGEACVIFGSGYLANLGVIQALGGEGKTVLSDALNHASIVDGCRLARARTFVYRHRDAEHLEWGLRQAGYGQAVIATDGVFSMDGELCDLPAICDLARRYGARVIVDEAHATGTLGPSGRGTVAHYGLEDEVDVIIGTLGKALGTYGAYAVCSKRLATYLINRARTQIFSTALPPPIVASARAALEVLIESPDLVASVQRNGAALRAALTREGIATSGQGAICPITIGAADRATAVSSTAFENGVFCQAIRPPTVPEGTSRLRCTVMATHTESDIRWAATVLANARRRAEPQALPA